MHSWRRAAEFYQLDPKKICKITVDGKYRRSQALVIVDHLPLRVCSPTRPHYYGHPSCPNRGKNRREGGAIRAKPNRQEEDILVRSPRPPPQAHCRLTPSPPGPTTSSPSFAPSRTSLRTMPPLSSPSASTSSTSATTSSTSTTYASRACAPSSTTSPSRPRRPPAGRAVRHKR